MKRLQTHLPLRVALAYILFGGLWILVSDRLVAAFVSHPAMLTRVQTYKGEIFVLASAALLYFLLRFELRKRRQAEETTRRHLAELEAVNRISTSLRAAQTLNEMLPRLLDETLAVLEAGAGCILLYNPESRTLDRAVARGFFARLPVDRLDPTHGIAGTVFTGGAPHLSPEFACDPLTLAFLQTQLPGGWGGAAVPLRTADETVGVLYVSVQLPRQLTPGDAHLLATLAEIAGSAIHRTDLDTQTRRRLQRISALHAIDQAISASLDLGPVLPFLLEQVQSELKADAASILLFVPQTRTLDEAARLGFYDPGAERFSQPLGQGVAGAAAQAGQTVRIPDLAQAGLNFWRASLFAREGFAAYFGVPLYVKGDLKGMLEVFHRTRLHPDAEWLDFLETLASQAAIAIENAALIKDLQDSNHQLALAYDTTLAGWSRALELRDKETQGHTDRVVQLTGEVAIRLDLGEAERLNIRRGTLLHDIGKMGIPDKILQKPGPLDDEEWKIMRLHPGMAYQLLAPIAYLRPALDIPYCHHEHWDGRGYPRGLKGLEIPLAARIFALVDVWDALRHNRPYRPAWPAEQVIDYIQSRTGAQFDPALTPVFLEMVTQPSSPSPGWTQ